VSTKAKVLIVAGTGVAVALVFAVKWIVWARSYAPPVPCRLQLQVIAGAKDQWAIEKHLTTNDLPTWETISVYLPRGLGDGVRRCPDGGTYTLNRVGDRPTCSIGGPSHSLK
jgi:hypothetical protein